MLSWAACVFMVVTVSLFGGAVEQEASRVSDTRAHNAPHGTVTRIRSPRPGSWKGEWRARRGAGPRP